MNIFKKICRKFYEVILILYTFYKRGYEKDPSNILIDFYTDEQTVAQKELDLEIPSVICENIELLILIPFRDKWDLTFRCLKALSLQELTGNVKLKVVLLNNNSSEEKTFQGIEKANSDLPNLSLTTLNLNYDFNFSRINNEAFSKFVNKNTTHVLFLNNDVVISQKNTIALMLKYIVELKNICAIGCNLLYENNKIQHLFAAPGVRIVAAHPLKNISFSKIVSWKSRPIRPVAAVTGAFMMVRRADFEHINGFDENLPTVGQDIDLCIRLGLKENAYCATLTNQNVYHLEGASRGRNIQFNEVRYFNEKWARQKSFEKFYSKKFSRFAETPLLKTPFEH